MRKKPAKTVGMASILAIGMTFGWNTLGQQISAGTCMGYTPPACGGDECAVLPQQGVELGMCIDQSNPKIDGDPQWCYCVPQASP